MQCCLVARKVSKIAVLGSIVGEVGVALGSLWSRNRCPEAFFLEVETSVAKMVKRQLAALGGTLGAGPLKNNAEQLPGKALGPPSKA